MKKKKTKKKKNKEYKIKKKKNPAQMHEPCDFRNVRSN